MCADVAKQKPWAGQWLDKEDWKRLFVAAIYGQQILPGLEGGFVVLNKLTRKMRVAECIEVIDYIRHWGDSQGVNWSVSND